MVNLNSTGKLNEATAIPPLLGNHEEARIVATLIPLRFGEIQSSVTSATSQ